MSSFAAMGIGLGIFVVISAAYILWRLNHRRKAKHEALQAAWIEAIDKQPPAELPTVDEVECDIAMEHEVYHRRSIDLAAEYQNRRQDMEIRHLERLDGLYHQLRMAEAREEEGDASPPLSP